MKRFSFLLLAFALVGCDNNPRAGETWIYEVEHSPFSECDDRFIRHTYQVIEVKGGWVKYNDEDGQTKCDKTDWFIIGANRKK